MNDKLLDMQKEKQRPCTYELQSVPYVCGDLYFGQNEEPFPFPVNRIYFVKDVPAGAARGGHSHRKNEEIVYCIHGACTLWLFSPDQECYSFRLDEPSKGAYVPPGWWVELGEYDEGSITLVVASLPFSETDYIRDPKAFFHDSPYPDSVYRSRP